MDQQAPLRIGDVIHGHASGIFGRDFWGPAQVEFIASDWIVVRRREDHTPWFAHLAQIEWSLLLRARDESSDE